MRQFLPALLIPTILAAPAGAKVLYAGGDGTSQITAVVILGAKGEDEGIASEYAWLAAHRPGAKVLRQALVQDPSRVYDVLTLAAGAESQEVWFDITGYFGR